MDGWHEIHGGGIFFRVGFYTLGIGRHKANGSWNLALALSSFIGMKKY
jgi:hypothetical protein